MVENSPEFDNTIQHARNAMYGSQNFADAIYAVYHAIFGNEGRLLKEVRKMSTRDLAFTVRQYYLNESPITKIKKFFGLEHEPTKIVLSQSELGRRLGRDYDLHRI